VGLRVLRGAAWAVFAGNALVTLVLVGSGLASSDRADASIYLALLATVPLAGLLALVYFGSRANGPVRLWFGLLLGAIPLFFVIEMIGEQHGLWPRM
jgi:hypothetical protein